ncbi:MAG: hypothetical protein ABIF77_12565 [bacterium]
MASRNNKLFRRLLPLVLALVLGGLWLLWLQLHAGDNIDPDAGGPLFPVSADAVTRLEVDLQTRRVILERTATGWQLSGSVSDWPDTALVASLLRSVCGEFTTPVLSGTDRRSGREQFGLGSSSELSLRLTSDDGSQLDLTIGAVNRLSERFHAAGAGRSGVFTMSPELVGRLVALPDAVRLRRMWPSFSWANVDSLVIQRTSRAAPDHFAKAADGSWWLRESADGDRRLGVIAREYEELYGGRRREADSDFWWRVSDRAVVNLLFQLGETAVKEFDPEPVTEAKLKEMGLSPPTVQVRIDRNDIQARYEVAIGSQMERDRMAAIRNDFDNILLVTIATRDILLSPLASFLETGALPFLMATADSFSLRRDDRPPLFAWWNGEAWQLRSPNRTPNPDGQVLDENLLADLVVYLDRLELEQVLPPLAPAEPPNLAYQVDLTAWLPPAEAGGDPQQQQFSCGLIPYTSRAVLYFPADGMYLQVPKGIHHTLRSIFLALNIE